MGIYTIREVVKFGGGNKFIIKKLMSTFLEDQIAETKDIITAINTAIKSLLNNEFQSYELDTGQYRQRVTKLDLGKLKDMRREYLVQLQELEAAAGVSRSVVAIQPDF